MYTAYFPFESLNEDDLLDDCLYKALDSDGADWGGVLRGELSDRGESELGENSEDVKLAGENLDKGRTFGKLDEVGRTSGGDGGVIIRSVRLLSE